VVSERKQKPQEVEKEKQTSPKLEKQNRKMFQVFYIFLLILTCSFSLTFAIHNDRGFQVLLKAFTLLTALAVRAGSLFIPKVPSHRGRKLVLAFSSPAIASVNQVFLTVSNSGLVFATLILYIATIRHLKAQKALLAFSFLVFLVQVAFFVFSMFTS